MVKTKIEWCDSTWNPVTGCRHGCEYCYAQGIAERFGGYDKVDGTVTTHCPLPRAELSQPLTITRNGGKKDAAPYPFGFEPTLYRYRLKQPQKWVKPQNIFVCSMADLFGDWVPDSWIEETFKAAQAADRHRYLFLTKNPTRYCQLHDADKLPQSRFAGEESRRMWYGTTITKNYQPFWDGSADFNTFVSIEPLLEDLVIDPEGIAFGALNWIIIGAETGIRKDKVTPKAEWVDRIVRAADNRGIPVFMKDSLIPIMGEDRMRREFPWEIETMKETGQGAGAYADQPTMIPGA